MPPRRRTNANTLPTTEAELNERISQAIAQYEANRTEHSGGTRGSSGGNFNTGCSYKQFLDCKPLNFDDTGDGALSWWNLQVQTKGEEAAYSMTWEELKELMRKKYCSRAEIQKLENEFWNLKMVGADIARYTQRFHDLSGVVPYLVEPECKRIERYMWGLAPEILSLVTSSKPTNITDAIDLVVALTEEAVRLGKLSRSGSGKKETHVESTSDGKTKFSNFKKGTHANNNNNNRSNKRREVNAPRESKSFAATNTTSGKGYVGSLPKCDKCKYHHLGACRNAKCEKCGKTGHSKETCWVGTGRGNQGGNNNQGVTAITIKVETGMAKGKDVTDVEIKGII